MSLSARSNPISMSKAEAGRFGTHSRLVVFRHGIEWHVQEIGDHEAPVALLVHGAGAASHSFRGLIPLLWAGITV
jgi:pimeloyl-ACP methyl ester carboxylesterase